MEDENIATLHYQGCLDDVSQLDAVLRMIRDQCDVYGWTRHEIDFLLKGRYFLMRGEYAYEAEVDLHWRGWSIDVHEKCDSLVLAFDDDGWLMFSFDYKDSQLITHELSVGTAYAMPLVHAQICWLLRRLQDQFARQEFTVIDPTGYFYTQDKVRLLDYWTNVIPHNAGSRWGELVDIADIWFYEDVLSLPRN